MTIGDGKHRIGFMVLRGSGATEARKAPAMGAFDQARKPSELVAVMSIRFRRVPTRKRSLVSSPRLFSSGHSLCTCTASLTASDCVSLDTRGLTSSRTRERRSCIAACAQASPRAASRTTSSIAATRMPPISRSAKGSWATAALSADDLRAALDVGGKRFFSGEDSTRY